MIYHYNDNNGEIDEDNRHILFQVLMLDDHNHQDDHHDDGDGDVDDDH